MQSDDKILKIISNETKHSINSMEIVTPSMYSTLFSKFATSHNADITDEYKLTDSMLEQKISHFTNIQKQNADNVNRLSEQTSNALSAIKIKDDKLLVKVLAETEILRQEIEKLKEDIYRDELTYAFNRKWLNDSHTKDQSDELKSNGVLAIIDLNYFKIINDTYGHIVGDKVLHYIAKQLQTSNAPVVRYGGDEFIILFLTSISHNDALAELNEIRENILRKNLKIKESSFKASFSFGIKEFKEGDSLAHIIEEADKNMYNDKLQIKKRIAGIH